jgi:hypothetical protein
MRQDQWSNTVTIDGQSMGVWDTLSGGGSDSEETKYKPGGMQPEVSLGGSKSIGNLTLSRLCDRADWGYMSSLMNKTGSAKCVVSRQPLDADGNPWGQPMVYGGILKAVMPGDTDSNSSGAQIWDIEISTEGSVA